MPKTIMIIEDEADIRDYLMAVLEDHGYRTCSIEEHEPVLDAMRAHRPDVVVMDIMMPRRSGLSIYKEMRCSPELADIPVALMSGVSAEFDIQGDGFRALMDDPSITAPDGFLEKPIDLGALKELIEKLTTKKGSSH